ncbi:hypothetical protein SAMN05216349_10321 [Oribacterium sp. KHPX15]|uniref:zinc ribbon domain-containing protein n=1 Tax=Oribacterium sp. KHPX15 TaxID=1855342 RepID=UPI00089C20ED|nr:zinc ribbon domain-containing protein [Oribacterium sp. KHPX15]SDZ95624.1 hypothetical protein SAMN05216349_10321 [Oribacterium sp. KHPX15]
MEKENAGGSKLTVRKVLRILSIICIVMVFCPSFIASFFSFEMQVSVMAAAGGITIAGEEAVEPYPIMYLCVIIPILLLVLLYKNKQSDEQNTSAIFLIGLVDAIMWLYFRKVTEDIASQNYCLFKTTGWYVLNMISLGMILVMSGLVGLQKLQMDADINELLSRVETEDSRDKMSESTSQMSRVISHPAENVSNNTDGVETEKKDVIRFCGKCGGPLVSGADFCPSCGAPVLKRFLEEAEAARKGAEVQVRKEEPAKKMTVEVSKTKEVPSTHDDDTDDQIWHRGSDLL